MLVKQAEPFFQGCLLLALSCSLGTQIVKILVADLMAAEDEKARVGNHAIGRAQPVCQGFPVAQEQLLHFYVIEGAAFQPLEQFADLNDRRQEKAQGCPGPYGCQCLIEICPGRAHIQEQGIGLGDTEAVGHILDMDFDIASLTGPVQVPAGQLCEFLSCIVAHYPAGGAAEPGQGKGEAAGTTAGLADGAPWTCTKPQADIGHILGIDDLCLPLDALEQILQGYSQYLYRTSEVCGNTVAEIDLGDIVGSNGAVLAMPDLSADQTLQGAFALGRDAQDKGTVRDHRNPFAKS